MSNISFPSNSSDLYGKDDSEFLEALAEVESPGDPMNNTLKINHSATSSELFGTDDPGFLEALENAYVEEASQPSRALQAAKPDGVLKRKRPTSPSSELEDDDTRYIQKQPTQECPNTYTDSDIYGASKFQGWGEYMQRKRAKLSIQNSELESTEGGKKSDLFKGLAIHVNGKTDPSVQVLRKLIVKHGGTFIPYLDRKKTITHIITSNLTPAKVLEFKNMKVVTPAWLLDSEKAGVLLPWRDFIIGADARTDESQGRAISSQSLSLRSHNRSASDTTTSEAPVAIADTAPMNPAVNASVLKVASARPLYGTDPVKIEEAHRIPSYAAYESNPVAKRKMEDPKWRTENTAAAPGFIEGYYKNSRLHHLSTWKAELQDLVAKAIETIEDGESDSATSTNILGESVDAPNNGRFQFRKPTSPKKGKSAVTVIPTIMHCDFDSFFVSAGLVDRPDLKGKPVVVCHSQGTQGGAASTSEIASSSYEARKFGIKNGMSLGQAKKLCPDLQTIPYEFERYKRFSLQFYTILMSYADELQAVSVDEALIDVTTTVENARKENAVSLSDKGQDVAKELAETVRMRVKNATGCEVSIGISHNILLARVATRRAKPAGSFHIFPEEAEELLAPLDIEDIRGFGWSTRNKVQERFGVTTLGELKRQPKGTLCDALGKKTGETLWKAIRGIDEAKLETDHVRKSVSCEINYGIRFQTQEETDTFVRNVGKEASERLKKIGMLGRSLTLKIMVRDPAAPVEAPKFLGHGICETMSKTVPLAGINGRATADENSIGDCAVKVLQTFKVAPKELRGIGLHIQKLEKASDDAGKVTAATGQSILAFKKVGESTKSAPSTPTKIGKEDSQLPTTREELEEGNDKISRAQDSIVLAKPQIDLSLPSFSQVDATVLEALPDDIRNELEQAYSNLKKGHLIAGPSRHADALVTDDETPKNKNKTAATDLGLSRITQQLRPKSQPSPAAVKQFHPLFARRKASTTVNVSFAELKLLNIDAEVWKQLPVDVQREQLAAIRAANVGTGMAIRASMSIEARRARLLRLWRKKRWTAPASIRAQRYEIFAKPVELPALKQRGKGNKRVDIKVNDIDEIQGVLAQWVEGFEQDGPSQRDIDYFGKFLCKCVETDVGMERGLAALKWWLYLLRQRWKEEEEGLAGPIEGKPSAGKLWWKALLDVKERMNGVVQKRLGGRLSLK